MTEDPNVPNYMRSTGRPMGEYWGFVAEGLFQTEEEIAHSAVYGPTLPGDIKLKDINGDGKITYDQDRVPIGRSSTPEMMFGLNIGAEWKGIDFSMLWQGAALFDVNLCGMYANVGYDNTFYTKPFIVMVILLTIWWKTLGVLIIRMRNILVWVLFHGIMVVKCLLGGWKWYLHTFEKYADWLHIAISMGYTGRH